MTVKELIDELQRYDGDREVVLAVADVPPVLHELMDLETRRVHVSSDWRAGIEFSELPGNCLELAGSW
ncbi:hypothetical protein [Streptococcus ruminantium]|uniref:hypothetical protein n=1 Tax=Streptococcus ruminantium TaxID=1917441 RepID=UPI0012DE0419|nr:hypothetical protein [Streptococcus ruminantium]